MYFRADLQINIFQLQIYKPIFDDAEVEVWKFSVNKC